MGGKFRKAASGIVFHSFLRGLSGYGAQEDGLASFAPGDDDPAHHSASFVRDAVIVVNPFHGQPDLEAVAFVNQITGIPGRNSSWNTQGMVIVGRMVCGRCMHIVPVVHPADPLAWSDQDATGIKCDQGAIRGAAHEDFGNLLTLSVPDEMSPSQAGQPEAAGPQRFPSEA